MSYLDRLKLKKEQTPSLPKLTKPTKPLVSAVLAVSAVPPDAHLEKNGIDPSLMTEIERYCKESTSNPDQLKNWMDYFVELAAEHPAICLLCVTEPPVWKKAAEREQIGKHAKQRTA